MNEVDKQLKDLWMDAFNAIKDEVLNFIVHNPKQNIPHYFNYPKRIEDRENGFPNFLKANVMPFNCLGLISVNHEVLTDNEFEKTNNKIYIWTINEVLKLLDFMLIHKDLYKKRMGIEEDNSKYIMSIILLLIYGVERYFNINDEVDYNKLANKISDELLFMFYNDKLNYIQCIPVLCLSFEVEKYYFNNDIYLERMNDMEQISRMEKIIEYYYNEKDLIGNSLFALKINSFIDKKNLETHKDFYSYYYDIDKYSVSSINNWFAALRIITTFETGYSQLLNIPQGWTTHYIGALQPIFGIKINEFNINMINKKAWEKSIPVVTIEQLDRVKELFVFLENNIKKSKIKIAVDRLNKSVIRNDYNDAIIDLVIAIEALLLKSDENAEMKYRITNRLSILICYLGIKEYTFDEIKKSMNQIYNYRSKLVHGDSINEEDRILKGSNRDILQISIEFVNYCFIAISKEQKFLNTDEFDKYLFADLNN